MEALERILGSDLNYLIDETRREELSFQQVKRHFVPKYYLEIDKFLKGQGFFSKFSPETQQASNILSFLDNPFTDIEYDKVLSKKTELIKELNGFVQTHEKVIVEEFANDLLGWENSIKKIKENYKLSQEKIEEIFFRSPAVTNQTRLLRSLNQKYGFKNTYNISFVELEKELAFGKEFAEDNHLPEYFTKDLQKQIPTISGFIGDNVAFEFQMIDEKKNVGFFIYHSINSDLTYGEYNFESSVSNKTKVSFPIMPEVLGLQINQKIGVQKRNLVFEKTLTDHVTLKISMPLFTGNFLAYFE